MKGLCYNIPGEAIMGEITEGGIAKIARTFPLSDEPITLLDIGSGAGSLLLHLSRYLLIRRMIGIEASKQRAQISRSILSTCTNEWIIVNENMLGLSSLPDGVTHSVSFDKTFVPKLMSHIQKLQDRCPTLRLIISNHKYSEDKWRLHAQVSVKMAGSGASQTFYVYIRK